MGRRKVLNAAQEHWLKPHIPSWLTHQASHTLDHEFYPPIYEEYFEKWPVPPVTAEDLAATGGDLAKAKADKYELYRKVSSVLQTHKKI